MLEYILPRALFMRILPRKAFLRLFHSRDDFNSADFYDVYAEECLDENELRKSEIKQLLDQFDVNGITFEEKTVLDVSGGPGFVAKHLKSVCARFVVTEYSEIATRMMSDLLKIETARFDYVKDQLQDIFSEKFDIVLLRSSIIFCPRLDNFVADLRTILNPGGYVLVETILPSLGEVFWWQQMEWKFPIIYSQETIEKYFYKHGFSLKYGYRDYGSYLGIKKRCTKNLAQKLFTWLVDYPMVLIYYALARKSRIPIDQRLHHKMLTQIWQQTDSSTKKHDKPYLNYMAGIENQSTHFSFTYNGYLKK